MRWRDACRAQQRLAPRPRGRSVRKGLRSPGGPDLLRLRRRPRRGRSGLGGLVDVATLHSPARRAALASAPVAAGSGVAPGPAAKERAAAASHTDGPQTTSACGSTSGSGSTSGYRSRTTSASGSGTTSASGSANTKHREHSKRPTLRAVSYKRPALRARGGMSAVRQVCHSSRRNARARCS